MPYPSDSSYNSYNYFDTAAPPADIPLTILTNALYPSDSSYDYYNYPDTAAPPDIPLTILTIGLTPQIPLTILTIIPTPTN